MRIGRKLFTNPENCAGKDVAAIDKHFFEILLKDVGPYFGTLISDSSLKFNK